MTRYRHNPFSVADSRETSAIYPLLPLKHWHFDVSLPTTAPDVVASVPVVVAVVAAVVAAVVVPQVASVAPTVALSAHA